jgi:hypothetical protein
VVIQAHAVSRDLQCVVLENPKLKRTVTSLVTTNGFNVRGREIVAISSSARYDASRTPASSPVTSTGENGSFGAPNRQRSRR